jgi:glutamate-ammonia-ligase adenylyltransferase
LAGLEKLTAYEHLSLDEAGHLAGAYRFWRMVEHRLQMEYNLQTHALPVNDVGRLRIARLMGVDSLGAFEALRCHHAGFVRQIHEHFLPIQSSEESVHVHALPGDFETDTESWQALLIQLGFTDPIKAQRLLRQFIHGPDWAHVSHRTEELGRVLLPRFFALCANSPWPRTAAGPRDPVLSDPDRVLTRIDSFISAYGTRAPLYETWDSHPQFFELLLWLFDRSENLAELAIRTPDLIEEMVLSGRLRRSKTVEETLGELRLGFDDEDQQLWIRRYQQAEETRIGLRSILELAPDSLLCEELSNLADACIQYALEVVQKRHRWKSHAFGILALGKLAGRELNFGSDLDLLFVTTTSVRQLPGRQKGAAELLDLLSGCTDLGLSFEVDTRLRPDGEKGLLVNTLSGFLKYYQRRAQLWELQALSRIRFVAGDPKVAAAITAQLVSLFDMRAVNPQIAAHTIEWPKATAAMLKRIQSERTPQGMDALAIKTGTGGLMEAEFLAQFWCLRHGWHEPSTGAALQRGLESQLIPKDLGDRFLRGYGELRRIEMILRRWSFEGESVLPKDPSALIRVAIRCGYVSADALMDVVTEARMGIRQAAVASGFLS